MQQKESGFRAYFRELGMNIKIDTINIKTGTSGIDADQLKNNLNNKVNGIFITTSKAFLLPEMNVDFSIPVIGYDLLEKNIAYLKSGKIKFLIYQNPKLQAYQGLSMLSDHVIKAVYNPREKYLPIEIISLENVDSYQV
jgi:LacI family transcriptional regulator